MTSQHAYRADIDGLRAIAVLSVLIYHAGFYQSGQKLLAGGFLGVDIFFVISGYLIASILLEEINSGRLNFIAFFQRRARRILPALFFVMLCSAVVAPFLLSQQALEEFASSIAASGAFVANLFFQLQDSYTAEPSLRKPLLHTWSLAIEEQFYLLFPLFLWLIWKKWRSKFMLAFALVTVVSLLWAELGSYYSPNANFYLLPSRIWELIAGAMLACLNTRGKFKQAPGLLAYLGLALVIICLIMFDDSTRHPSLLTLLPLAGTVMIIVATPASPYLNKLLSSKPLVGVGLLSYSLYLWHQPVFAFARVYTGNELTTLLKFGLIILCLILAAISWRYVETPWRRADKASLRLFLRSLGSCGVVLFIFVVAVHTGGLTSVVASVTETASYPICRGRKHTVQDGQNCESRPPQDACSFVAGSGEQSWYLVGDSTASSLAYPLQEHLRNGDTRLVELTKGGCPYIPNTLVLDDGKVVCSKADNLLRRKILRETSPSVVVIHSLLHIYIHGSRQRPHLESKTFKIHTISHPRAALSMQDVSRHVNQAIKELLQQGHTVVLVYPIHMADFDMQHRLADLEKMPLIKRKNLLATKRFSKSYQEFKTFAEVAYQIYDAIGDHPNLIRVLPEKLFCHPSLSGRCRIFAQDASLYVDFTHLSYFGACQLVKAIFAALPRQMDAGSEHVCRPFCQ